MEMIEDIILEDRKKRLNKAVKELKYKGIVKTQEDIASKMEASRPNVSSALHGKKEALTTQFITRFCDAFAINHTWLLNGTGNMLKEDSELNEMRPRLPMNVDGHGISEYLNGTMSHMCDKRPLIKQFPQYDFTLVLKNDSMAPKYWRGDEIALRKVETFDHNTIEWGHEYVIDTMKFGPRLKRIYEEGSAFLLRSYDEVNYPDFLVQKSEVYAIYKVVGMIRM